MFAEYRGGRFSEIRGAVSRGPPLLNLINLIAHSRRNVGSKQMDKENTARMVNIQSFSRRTETNRLISHRHLCHCNNNYNNYINNKKKKNNQRF